MKDADLIRKVKEHGADEEAVREMLLELMEDKEVTPEQVIRCLDDSGEWLGGYPGSDDGVVTCVNPTFAVSVTTEYERLSGNANAYCC